ncbi:MAG: hypothetical protein HY722_01630 [Planctomycetes bacterium]|nr:hypothetical protein [Planctomycetota bacterium]
MDLIREAEAKATQAETKTAPVAASAAAEARSPAGPAARKAPARKAPSAPRASRSAGAGGGGREKAVWGVFDPSFKRVALFEWRDRALADRKAQDLSQKDGGAYVVRPARVPMKD